jgi:geranylgeranyl pyrophosphate synthase
VGGDPRQAVMVAAAFELARLAARVLDDVEDLDREDALWRQVGVPQATNAGTALLACAYLALADLATLGVDPALIVELQQDFAGVALAMAAAQHLDLTTWEELLANGRWQVADSVWRASNHQPSAISYQPSAISYQLLDRYWEIAAGKSGAFFALGCRAGARLAVPSEAAQPYSDFGYHLGLLLQALNDGRGLPSTALEAEGLPAGLGRGGVQDLGRRLTLPVAYILAVCPELRQPLLESLQSLLQLRTPTPGRRPKASGPEGPGQAADEAEVVTIMAQAGAVHYLLAVAESHRREAIVALDRARGDPVAHQSLLDLLPEVLPAAGEKQHS